jgi:hypothetical protein
LREKKRGAGKKEEIRVDKKMQVEEVQDRDCGKVEKIE